MRDITLPTAILVTTLLSSLAHAELVDNPAYTAWAKFQPLSSVSYETTTGAGFGHGAGSSRTTYRLAGVTPESVTIELLITLPHGGQPQTISRGAFTIPSKIEKGAPFLPPLDLPEIESPKLTASTTGQDSVEIKGIKTSVTTLDQTLQATLHNRPITLRLKSWTTPSIPGGLYKLETEANMTLSDGRDSGSKRTRTLVDFHIEPSPPTSRP